MLITWWVAPPIGLIEGWLHEWLIGLLEMLEQLMGGGFS